MRDLNPFPAIAALAERTGLDPHHASAAAQFVTSGVPSLGVSGWLASGKDTVAEAVFARLGIDAVQHSFGAALKHELDDILDIVRYADSRREVHEGIRAFMTCSDDQAAMLIEALVPGDLAQAQTALATCNARSRTPAIRLALQVLGTDIRRAQNEDYWVDQGLKAALGSLALGQPVYFTDCRFANEVEGIQRIGIPAVRLDVSHSVQAQRLMDRDGLEIDPVAASHPSETALDTYPSFDLRVDNDGPVEAAVEAVVTAFSWEPVAAR